MHVKQMPAAAYPDACTAEHSTQHCWDTQSSSPTLHIQGDLTLHTHNVKLLLGTLTSLRHRTVTTVEHKSRSHLHCSNTLGNTNSYLYVTTLAALMVCTYAKTPTLSPLLWFGFFELWWVFLPKPHKHLLSIKGTNTQHIYPPTKDLVIKWVCAQ